jgi:hypothetical protein
MMGSISISERNAALNHSAIIASAAAGHPARLKILCASPPVNDPLASNAATTAQSSALILGAAQMMNRELKVDSRSQQRTRTDQLGAIVATTAIGQR